MQSSGPTGEDHDDYSLEAPLKLDITNFLVEPCLGGFLAEPWLGGFLAELCILSSIVQNL